MDLSTSWAFWQQHKNKSGQLLLLMIVFIIGWYLGQTTSPYYQSTPIVFEDQACARSSGDAADLNAVVSDKTVDPEPQEQVQASPDSNPAMPVISVSPQTTPQVAGSIAGSLPVDKKYVGSINSDLFHDLSCPASKGIKESNQIWFASVEEAQRAGYSPSKCTKEKLGL